jgi:DNA-directed RNA polymerase specialized sigma24 family protein
VQRARARLAAELEALPPWGSPLLAARLRVTAPPQMVSLGALTHFLRGAVRLRDMRTARTLFEVLLRTAGLNVRWAAGVVARTPGLVGEAGAAIREELAQELALTLWQQIGCAAAETWELFFFRALAYAQQHTATAYMEQRGYWRPEGVRRPRRALPHLLAQLGVGAGGATGAARLVADPRDTFTAAELADLRALVLALPIRERTAVVLCYWQEAPEREIADALAVSTRTVRAYLRRAHDALRTAYQGSEDES